MFGRKRHDDPYPADPQFVSKKDRAASEADRPKHGAAPGGTRGEGRLPGVNAESPADIPKAGWLQITKRAFKETKDDNVPLLAAGVAYYAFIAVFPALLATATIFGLFADPATVTEQVGKLTGALGEQAGGLIGEPLQKAADANSGALGVGLIVGLVAALWAASGGMQGLIKAINLAYDETETRKFLKLRARALVLAVGAIAFFAVTIGLIAVLPALFDNMGLGAFGVALANVARWVGLFAFVVAALAVVYRYGPDRDEPKFRWVSIGSVVATVLWLVGSALFALYVNNFSNYDKTYGSIAAVVVLLLWLYLTAYIILFGAEINAEMEHQTAQDTTKGPDQPMGTRGAEMADTLPGDETEAKPAGAAGPGRRGR
ncbi:MAG: Ribonuclease [Frankiales bacterium]|nr:Ribonuclease [Frankiales bacterium]